MGPFDRFNDRAKRVLALAQDEAIRFGHNYIGPEHVLLGLVREGEGVAAKRLAAAGVELSRSRAEVERTTGRGDCEPGSEISLLPRTKKLLELAVDEAQRLGATKVGTEHLLLGLIREVRADGGTAADVLRAAGVDLDRLREDTIAAIGQSGC